MAKLIKGNKKQFTIIDNNIFKDRRLHLKDTGLLCLMLSLPDNWSFSIKGLSSLCPDGKDSVRAGIENLERYGYLTRKQARDDGGSFSGYNYYIYSDPSENEDYHPETEETESENLNGGSPLSENPTTVNPTTGNPTTAEPASAEPSSDNPTQYITNKSSTQESSTKQSITEIIKNIKDSESAMDQKTYSGEEIMSWDYEEFYNHLNKEENEAFLRLYEASIKGEIRTCKDSLIEYFKKMMIRGWKDASGRKIRNIEGYVRRNFELYVENLKYRKNSREDIIPTYDTSKNPSFNEEEYNRIMEERNRKGKDE